MAIQQAVSADTAYKQLLNDLLTYGKERDDRTKTGTLSLFDYQVKLDVSTFFPFVTLKQTNAKATINEWLWMVVHGSTDVRWLQARGHKFWNEWMLPDGTIGKGYGKQFRDCDGVDQVQNMIDGIKADPYSRRHIIDIWTPKDIDEMALPPCHSNHIQAYIEGDEMSLAIKARSQDVLLGLPINWGFYGLMLYSFCHLTGYKPKTLSITATDLHLYSNHIEQAKLLVSREAKGQPKMEIVGEHFSIDDFKFDSFKISGYDPHPNVTGKVAV